MQPQYRVGIALVSLSAVAALWSPPAPAHALGGLALAPAPRTTLPAASSGATAGYLPPAIVGLAAPIEPAYAVGPIVNATSTTPAAEQHISVDPLDPTHHLAAITDYAPRFDAVTKYAESFDNGSTWSENYIELDADLRPVTSDASWDAEGDPVVAIDNAGNSYLAHIYFDRSDQANGLYVSSSSGGPISFTAATTSGVAVNTSPTSPNFEDKPWIAVDNSGPAGVGGPVYVSWTRFMPGSNAILLSTSLDQGVTWSGPVQVSPASQNGSVQGSQVAVGPDGTVYVSWEVFFTSNLRQIWTAKSTDGGNTFSVLAPATPFYSEVTFSSTYRKNSFPAMAVNPLNSTVSIEYASQSGSSSLISVVTSAGGTLSFGSPVVVNDNQSGQRFFPALAYDTQGVLHSCWFDTRNSPSNANLYDIYAAQSFTLGSSWTPNTRVTPGLIAAGSFIGDYTGIDAAGGFAHPVWTRGGFNGGLLQTATLQ